MSDVPEVTPTWTSYVELRDKYCPESYLLVLLGLFYEIWSWCSAHVHAWALLEDRERFDLPRWLQPSLLTPEKQKTVSIFPKYPSKNLLAFRHRTPRRVSIKVFWVAYLLFCAEDRHTLENNNSRPSNNGTGRVNRGSTSTKVGRTHDRFCGGAVMAGN